MWPGFKFKTLTLSYDDGVTTDVRLIDILKRHGIKATFHINSLIFGKGGEIFPKGSFGRLSLDEAKALYINSGHEIAIHTLHHRLMPNMNPIEAFGEVFEDKRNIEAEFGVIVRGLAYPMGGVCDDIKHVARSSGLSYARSSNSTLGFSLPTDRFNVNATCHHNHPKLDELCDTFINRKYICPELFFLRGHSYEFEKDDNWELIENFCEKMGNRDDMWYATSIEIFDYIDAYKSLQYSANADRIHNPSAIPVYVWVNGERNVLIAGGTTVDIK